ISFELFLLVFSSRERRETPRSARQTTRLSSSSTRRLVKVADLRLLRGKSLDTRGNLSRNVGKALRQRVALKLSGK
ncbi:MAG: hypothetical protein ACE5K3_09670, partial [bacterium]